MYVYSATSLCHHHIPEHNDCTHFKYLPWTYQPIYEGIAEAILYPNNIKDAGLHNKYHILVDEALKRWE